MFTGIIETLARVEKIENENSNINFTFSSKLTHELKIDQSVAHNGVCLTVVKIEENNYTVTAINETLKKTNLGTLNVGNHVNIERCMPANGRFDGHIVQGHVDTTAKCVKVNLARPATIPRARVAETRQKGISYQYQFPAVASEPDTSDAPSQASQHPSPWSLREQSGQTSLIRTSPARPPRIPCKSTKARIICKDDSPLDSR